MKIKFLFSPYFLNKYYLLRETKNIARKYKFTGYVIDVGCGVKPYRYLFKNVFRYDGVDYKNYSKNDEFNSLKPDFFFDKNYNKTLKLPFKDNSYNNTFAFQVLEHHPNPEKLIAEAYRITKKGGYVLMSVPFMGGIHEEPNDYQRYTRFGLLNLFNKNKLKIIELNSYGSIFSTISMLLNENICNFANKSKIKYFVSILIYPPFFGFQFISLLLDLIFKSDHIVRGYLVLARK